MKPKNAITGLVALTLGCATQTHIPEQKLSFLNKNGSEYNLSVKREDSNLFVTGIDEYEHWLHYREAESKEDTKICPGDYVVLTSGSQEFPQGHEESITRIVYYIGEFSYHDQPEKTWIELWDVGTHAKDITPMIMQDQDGRDYFLFTLPENRYLGWLDRHSSCVAIDQNGYLSSDGNPNLGEKILITQKNGSLLNLDEILKAE